MACPNPRNGPFHTSHIGRARPACPNRTKAVGREGIRGSTQLRPSASSRGGKRGESALPPRLATLPHGRESRPRRDASLLHGLDSSSKSSFHESCSLKPQPGSNQGIPRGP